MASEPQEKSGEYSYFSFANHEKPTIAYFTESSGGFYANEKWWLWQGVMNACRERDMNVLHVSGSDFSSNPEAVLYDILDTNKIDGILSWHSFVSSKSNADDFLEFLGSFHPLPVVTIENKVANIPAVLIDDFFGMRKLIDHLVSVHHFNRIAMVSEASWHAFPRINAYQQIMHDYGIADKDLLLSQAEIRRRIEAFPEEELGFQALITAVDGDAISIMQEFQDAGIRIPQDVVITGYNDGKNVRLAKPPITAVSLPFYRMGYQGTAILFDKIQGHPVPSLTYIPLGLSIRESCGCHNQTVENVSSVPTEKHPYAGVWAQRGKIIRQMMNNSEINHRTRLRVWVNQLLNSFLHTFSSGEKDNQEFLSSLKTILDDFTQFGEESMDFNQILSTMRNELIKYTDEKSIGQFENLFEKARIIIAQKAVDVLENRNQLYLNRTEVLRDIERSNMLGQTFDEFFEELATILPRMKITGFYLITYLTPEDPTGRAQLRFAFQNQKKLPIPTEGIGFFSSQLLPEEFQKNIDNSVFIIEDLHVEEEQIGYLIFACDNTMSGEDGIMYSIFSTQIGSAIKGIHLREEVRSAWQRAEENARISEERRIQAEETNNFKSRFLSVVSHELRNPINLISANIELANTALDLQPPQDEAQEANQKLQKKYLNRINKSTNHLNALIGDVLDLTRNQMGDFNLKTKPVDLTKLLEEIADSADTLTKKKGLIFETVLQSGLPTLEIDEMRIRQVMLNLLGNALKFTDQGKITLSAERNNENVQISITDTGIGIPIEEQSVIFNEFQQSERTSTRGFGGMGLGLAISRQIIEEHHGKIAVTSSGIEGIGSTFTIYLPINTNTTEPIQLIATDKYLAYLFSNNPNTIHQVSELLHNKGYAIQVFPISEEAFNPSQTSHPAFILLDISPEEIIGTQLLTQIKSTPQFSEVPIIFLSGEQETLRSSMPITTLQKPFESAQLHSILTPYISTSPADNNTHSILIVDDDPDLLQSEAELIRVQCPHCKVLTANNGKKALEILLEELPNLVLLDLMMPEINGFRVIESMQENSSLRNIPVIVLTAQSLSKEDMKFFEKGVVAILQKGVVDNQVLNQRIDLILKNEFPVQTERRSLVRKAMVYIHQNYHNSITRSDLANEFGVNEDYLTHCFSQETGMPPNKYLNRFRIEQAKKQMLENPSSSITQVAMDAGFSSQAYFSRVFRKEAGISPKEFRAKNNL